MFGVIRRYEGVDQARVTEIMEVARDELVPQLAAEPGFAGYFLLDDGAGVIASLSVYDTREGAERSNEIAATLIRDQGLSDAMPTAPQVTAGEVKAHKVLQATTA
jgi:hypothetical protein